ncbi:hypothetical protein Hanom_Chr05g00386621 [Helianthus anomalus]
MYTRFSGRSSPLLFDPEEKTARQNLVLRSALKGKAPVLAINPLESQLTLNQQTPQQDPLLDMPPPPFQNQPQSIIKINHHYPSRTNKTNQINHHHKT